uniref:Uncharacterized protein n=1 Tax=Anguilla anguilla TaxID=7936 RepID=A0A0E9XCJ2_ANGAN
MSKITHVCTSVLSQGDSEGAGDWRQVAGDNACDPRILVVQ